MAAIMSLNKEPLRLEGGLLDIKFRRGDAMLGQTLIAKAAKRLVWRTTCEVLSRWDSQSGLSLCDCFSRSGGCLPLPIWSKNYRQYRSHL
jgi:hypothetical protein